MMVMLEVENKGDRGAVVMVEVKMVVVEKNKRGGGEDGGFVVVVVMLLKMVKLSPE